MIAFLSGQQYPLYAYTEIPYFLCEYAIKLYNEGDYDDALHEFNKAILIQSDNELAMRYIRLIEGIKKNEPPQAVKIKAPFAQETFEPVIEPAQEAPSVKELKSKDAVSKALEKAEHPISSASQKLAATAKTELQKKNKLIDKELKQFEKSSVASIPSSRAVKVPAKDALKKEALKPTLLILEEYLSTATQPLEIELGESIVFSGRNIQRFLVTEANIIDAQKQGVDELLLSGKNVGYTELHIWDDRGRSTIEIFGVLPEIVNSYEEAQRLEAEKAGNFKLRYAFDWSSIESGRRVASFNRISYSSSQGFGLAGDTPYGAFDSYAVVQRFKTSLEFTYYTAGLTNSRIGPFKGFDVRGFDFYPVFASNLAVSNVALRGAMVKAAMLNNKLDYSVYHGRESGGSFGNITPGVFTKNDLFLEGVNFSFSPTKKQNYKFNVAHGWGHDRQSALNSYAYDLASTWRLNDIWGLQYEIANNTERFAHILKATYNQPKFVASAEFRDIDKNYNTVRGSASRQGEQGGLFDLSYSPTEKLGINSSVNVYRDTINPALDNDTRLNEDVRWNANYQVDPFTYFGLSYNLQNQLGRVSQVRYQSSGIEVTRKFRLLRDINTYANYYHQENKSFSSPLSDYINDKFTAGLRFGIIGDLYYYFNKDLNWFEERFNGNHTMPHAYETGVEWYGSLGKASPFYGNFRFSYRDEEKTVSNLGFFAGEDYIENYAELAYRPNSDMEIFGSCRFRNIWAENPNASKRMEANFNTGMRYVWDTGVKWESIGTIDGYVFNDDNQDGLKESNELGISGVKLWLGKEKSIDTDASGYYRLTKVKAKKAYVSIDTKTIPLGYMLLSGLTQEIKMSHGQTTRIDFGLSNRSEISGIVFEDTNANGVLDSDDKGIRGLSVILEDGTKAKTDSSGKYSFRVEVGAHTVTLDLESLPAEYLPSVSIYKDFQVTEGMSFKHNIPLKKIQK